jgi:putative DNA primase/helicase
MPYAYTDLGNAMVLRDLCLADNLRYAPKRGCWYRHDGAVWRPMENDGLVMTMLQKVLAVRYAEVEAMPDQSMKEAAQKLVRASESGARLMAMLMVARQMPEVTLDVEAMDTDPFRLNCGNGALDLRSGILHKHTASDLYMLASPASYVPGSQCPAWLHFLDDIMLGRNDLIAYLQRALGYTLTGLTAEEVMFFPFGHGANGKTIFLETVRDVMGAYSKNTDSTTFLTKKGDAIRNDLARLRGSRFVTAVETGRGDHLDASLVKRMTSCDLITARFLFKEPFEFRPSWKIWMATNNKPSIPDVDHGIWRRIQVIPFEATFPIVQGVGARLRSALTSERSGILAWMVEGYKEWQRIGLAPPEYLHHISREYQDEQDSTNSFLTDTCYFHPDACIPINDLYAQYLGWCKKELEKPITKIELGRILKSKGLQQGRRTAVRYWLGLDISRAVQLAKLSDEDPGEAGLASGPDEDEEGD